MENQVKDTFFKKKRTLNCDGKLINLSNPIVMGVLNLTPDSFFDGGLYNNENDILSRVELMIKEGVDIIDIGAISTKPASKSISEQEELQRLIPHLKLLKKNFPEQIISIDTYRANIAKAAVLEGAHIINDISAGGFDKNMFRTIKELKVPYIIMHIQGTPENMQKSPQYENVVKDIIKYFSEKIYDLKQLGVNDIIIDPGFGFGKTLEHNYEILKNLSSFNIFELPILVGMSRKSMINKILELSPDEALNGTTVVNTIALLNGADILRVHDVKEAVEAIKIVEKIKNV